MLHLLEDKFQINQAITIEPWGSSLFEQAGISVSVLREDLNHPFLQGNKWHKLKCFLIKLLEDAKLGLASMGGAYSNHLQALAWAARQLNKRCVFWIRGSESEWTDNPAILHLKQLGADLISLSRSDFRRMYSDQEFRLQLTSEFFDFQWVPMGGSSFESIPFVAEWAQQLNQRNDFDFLALPVATAGTAAGFSLGLKSNQTVIGVEVLRTQGALKTDLERMILQSGYKLQAGVEWISEYDFGGYARKSESLTRFCREVLDNFGFPLEPVYSGKAFWAVSDLAQKGYFPEGTRILLVHTGGLFPWTILSNPVV